MGDVRLGHGIFVALRRKFVHTELLARPFQFSVKDWKYDNYLMGRIKYCVFYLKVQCHNV